VKSLAGTLVEEGVRERSVHVEPDSSIVLVMVVDSLQALFCKVTFNDPLGRI
jgi:hypothetical protein